MVGTSPSNSGGAGSIPGRGARVPHASRPKDQNKKKRQYSSKFNKDFGNGPHQINKQKYLRKKEREREREREGREGGREEGRKGERKKERKDSLTSCEESGWLIALPTQCVLKLSDLCQ